LAKEVSASLALDITKYTSPIVELEPEDVTMDEDSDNDTYFKKYTCEESDTYEEIDLEPKTHRGLTHEQWMRFALFIRRLR
jgi:hypothetical protein